MRKHWRPKPVPEAPIRTVCSVRKHHRRIVFELSCGHVQRGEIRRAIVPKTLIYIDDNLVSETPQYTYTCYPDHVRCRVCERRERA